MQEGLILQCGRDSAAACGQSRSRQGAPSGLFTADTSPLAQEVCGICVYDPNPQSGECLEFRIRFKTVMVWFGYICMLSIFL